MLEFNYSIRSNLTFDLKDLIKSHYTQAQLAKKLKMSRQQLNLLLNNPEQLSYKRLEQIINLCGYTITLELNKIEPII